MPPPSPPPLAQVKVATKSNLNPNVAEFKPSGMTEEEIDSKIGRFEKVSMVPVPEDYEPPLRKKRNQRSSDIGRRNQSAREMMPIQESGEYQDLGTTYYDQAEYSHSDEYCQCESCCGVDYYNSQQYYQSEYYSHGEHESVPPPPAPTTSQPPAQVSIDGTEWIHDPYAPVEIEMQNSHAAYNEILPPPSATDDYYSSYNSYRDPYVSTPSVPTSQAVQHPPEDQQSMHTHTITGPVTFQGTAGSSDWDEHRIIPGLLPAVVSAVTAIIVISHTACHKTAADIVREGLVKKDLKSKQPNPAGVGVPAIKKLLLSSGVTVPTQPREGVTILNRSQPISAIASSKVNNCPEGLEALATINGMLARSKQGPSAKKAVNIVTESELVQRIQEKAHQEMQKEKVKREQHQQEEKLKKVATESMKKPPIQPQPVVLQQKKEKSKSSNNGWKEVTSGPVRSAPAASAMSVAPVSVVVAHSNKKGSHNAATSKHGNRIRILSYANSSSESDPRSYSSSIDDSRSDSDSCSQTEEYNRDTDILKNQTSQSQPASKKNKKNKQSATNSTSESEAELLLQLSAIQKNGLGTGTAATVGISGAVKENTNTNGASNIASQSDVTRERQKKLQHALVERWKVAEEEERLIQEQTYRAMQLHKHDLREKADRDLRERQKEADQLIDSNQYQQALSILKPIYTKMTDSDHAHDTFAIATTVATCLLKCDQQEGAYTVGTAVIKLAKLAENSSAVVSLSLIVAQVCTEVDQYKYYKDACQWLSTISGVKSQSDVLMALKGLSQSVVELGVTAGLDDFHLIKCLIQLVNDSDLIASCHYIELSQVISLENSGDWNAVMSEGSISNLSVNRTSKLIIWVSRGMQTNWEDIETLTEDLNKLAEEDYNIIASEASDFCSPEMSHCLALINFAAKKLTASSLVSRTCDLATSIVNNCKVKSASEQIQFVLSKDVSYPHFISQSDQQPVDDFVAIVPPHHKHCWKLF